MTTPQGKDTVRIEDSGGVRRILLNRLDKKNALTFAMYEDLAAALAGAEADPRIHVVGVGSTGEVFSAGNDIGDFVSFVGKLEDSPVLRFLQVLSRFPKPIVAAVDGVAVGIGTTLLLHCDVVVASDRARFQLPFVKLALVPEAASSVLLPAVIGLRRATEWLLTGDAIDAPTALRYGLVNAVVPPTDLAAEAQRRADALAKLPPGAVCQTKALLRA
ncbi:MAG TPA: enoyl-CoA hydratase-related protein, partial [Myxococcota bacterium]|nr:enoyl-CoA hydratase-related protein [Myxococcota bacterium]